MTPSPEALEDDFTWVLRKALKAREMAPSLLAELAGAEQREILAFSRGRFSADLARRIAPHLDLAPDALAGHPGYHPAPALPDGLERLAFPFDEGFVNAWLVTRGDTSVLVDTGTSARILKSHLAEVKELQIFITHPHGDHVGGLEALRARPHTLHASPSLGIADAVPLTPGQDLRFAGLAVSVIDLDGHAPGHLGFRVDGLDVPVCAVGDALFAGSLGGTPDGERHALELSLVRSLLESLPCEALVLPGHGPPTTVALELEHNPFLA